MIKVFLAGFIIYVLIIVSVAGIRTSQNLTASPVVIETRAEKRKRERNKK